MISALEKAELIEIVKMHAVLLFRFQHRVDCFQGVVRKVLFIFGGAFCFANVFFFEWNGSGQQNVEKTAELPDAQWSGSVAAVAVPLGWVVFGSAAEGSVLFADFASAAKVDQKSLKETVRN